MKFLTVIVFIILLVLAFWTFLFNQSKPGTKPETKFENQLDYPVPVINTDRGKG